jgi:hypothetical protein
MHMYGSLLYLFLKGAGRGAILLYTYTTLAIIFCRGSYIHFVGVLLLLVGGALLMFSKRTLLMFSKRTLGGAHYFK